MNASTPWSVFTFGGSNYDGEHTFTTRQRARVFARQLKQIGVSTNIMRGNGKKASRPRMKIVKPQAPRIVIWTPTVSRPKATVPELHLTAPVAKKSKPQRWHRKVINNVPPLLALMQA